MGRKCKVFGCRTGYESNKSCDSESKRTIYGFPSDRVECQSWINALPNKDLTIENLTKNNGVCELHWPENVQKVLKNRHLVPAVPPGGTRLDGSSCFPNILPSCLPTPPPLPRPTKKSLLSDRNPPINEMPAYVKAYSFSSYTKSSFLSKFVKTLEKFGKCASGALKDEFILLSDRRDGPVFKYSLFFRLESDRQDLSFVKIYFEAYRGLKKTSIPFLSDGRINDFTQLDALTHFVVNNNPSESSSKELFIERQIQVLNTPRNSRLYSHHDLCSAFSWYARSRALYSDLRDKIHLPSESTLKKITRISKNMEDSQLYHSFFMEQDERSRNCLLLVDEIYVKASITYSGGMLFGYAEDSPDKAANKLLCIMVKCLFTSRKFLAKLIPVHTNSSIFQYNCVSTVIKNLEQCGARVLAIMSDNNSINTKFFKNFPGFDPDTPYVVNSITDPAKPMFLLFDTVHLLKNIRNNWITGVSQTLLFPSEGSKEATRKAARWSCIRELHMNENVLGKLSTLSSASVSPSPVERQKVSLVLQVISDKTVTALNTSSNSTQAWRDTSQFISLVLKLWKIFNCKSPSQCIRLRDDDKIPIDKSPRGEKALSFLKEWASIARLMRPHGKRDKTLTRDTSAALEWTCRGLIAMSEYLLNAEGPIKHNYVCLGFYQQDDLEHHFGHFRRSAGCNYFITVQEVMATHAIDRAKFMLALKDIPHGQEVTDTHSCDLCEKVLQDCDLLMLDGISEGEMISDISQDERMAIYYMAGYIASKHKELSNKEGGAEHEEVKRYLEAIDRGGLTQPSSELFSFMLYGYVFFVNTKEKFCRRRLTTVLKIFPDMFHLNLTLPQTALRRIANIFLKNFCRDKQSTDQSARKILKLSSSSQ